MICSIILISISMIFNSIIMDESVTTNLGHNAPETCQELSISDDDCSPRFCPDDDKWYCSSEGGIIEEECISCFGSCEYWEDEDDQHQDN